MIEAASTPFGAGTATAANGFFREIGVSHGGIIRKDRRNKLQNSLVSKRTFR